MNYSRSRTLSSALPHFAVLWQAALLLSAVLAPIIASGHPILLRELDDSGLVVAMRSPMLRSLTGGDWIFLLAPLIIGGTMLLRLLRIRAATALGAIAMSGALIAALALSPRPPLMVFDYAEREARGEVRAIYTLIPFSPDERPGERTAAFLPPNSPASGGRTHFLGTDRHGQDVLSRLVHGARLALSVGLIAAGIATAIGLALGAAMGYFGGWIDMVLSRVVEVVTGIPLLFVLVLAAAVMPRSIEACMAIIACFTWPTAARLTRAEVLRLRHADFILAARAAALPTRDIFLRHLIPNAAAPVIIDASFTVAAAVVIEATLSYLGLGPQGRPSWGTLLASATSETGEFRWWLAAVPGAAVFLTALSYNILGESLRDRLDSRAR